VNAASFSDISLQQLERFCLYQSSLQSLQSLLIFQSAFLLYPVYTIQPVDNRLFHRFDNRLLNRLYRVNGVSRNVHIIVVIE